MGNQRLDHLLSKERKKSWSLFSFERLNSIVLLQIEYCDLTSLSPEFPGFSGEPGRSDGNVGACSSVWLERTPDKREVDGSIPSRPTTGERSSPETRDQKAETRYKGFEVGFSCFLSLVS